MAFMSSTKLSTSSGDPRRLGAPGYSQSMSNPSKACSSIKCSALSAKRARLLASRAISPSRGCVTVPLSLNVHPPRLSQIYRPGLSFFRSVIRLNRLTGMDPSMGTMSKVPGVKKAKT